MKLNKLQSPRTLSNLETLPSIKPIKYKPTKADKSKMSEIELILYSTNLCLFSMRILRNEISVKNRDAKLQRAINEVKKLSAAINDDAAFYNQNYTHQERREFFKSVGLKPEHIKH